MKKKCARAAAELIKNGMTVGFGGGSTVGLLLEEAAAAGLKLQAVTPSMETEELCRSYHIPVLALGAVDRVDIAFDGCDELDHNFCALKSCGGIHTREKLVAAMADKYVILSDESKYFPALPFKFPVAAEVLPAARAYVKQRLETLGAVVTERHCSNKMGLTVTDDGNYLLDAKFLPPADIEAFSQELDAIPGIVGHSLFCGLIAGAVIAGKNDVRVIWK